MMRRVAQVLVGVYIGIVSAYFAFGLVFCSAAFAHGGVIEVPKELQIHQLLAELTGMKWVRQVPAFLWFSALVLVFMLVLSWRLLFRGASFQRDCWWVVPGVLGGIGLFPALVGMASFPWTLINAFCLRGLDEEWLGEADPLFEAFAFAYILLLVAIVVALARHEVAIDPGSGRESSRSPEEPAKLTI